MAHWERLARIFRPSWQLGNPILAHSFPPRSQLRIFPRWGEFRTFLSRSHSMTPADGYRSKILTLEELKEVRDKARLHGRRCVLCHGKFEVMHPGHVRHLEWARRQGDLLVVTLIDEEATGDGDVRTPLEARLEYVAALYMVDFVASVPCEDATLSVRTIQPDVLVRGQEFQTIRRQVAQRERRELEQYGGELVFSSGLGGHSVLTSEDRSTDPGDGTKSLLQLIDRHNIKLSRLEEVLFSYSGVQAAVIGDCMVDEYIFCDALGMSAEDPVIVVRPQKTHQYIGGAAIVAEHTQALGAQAHFFSVVGNDPAADFVHSHAADSGVQYHLFEDNTRPTTVKQRFIAAGKKLLRVSYLEERPISEEMGDALVRAFEERVESLNLVIFSDFSYGVNSPVVIDKICRLARKNGIKIVADVQCSSQIATVCKYADVDLITPTEREARMSLWDMDDGLVQIGLRLLKQTRNQDLIIKLGEKGMLILEGIWEDGQIDSARTEYLASFANEVNDPVGAGDALLAAASLALAVGASVFEASVLGNVAAAEEVQKVGNYPVTRAQMERRLAHLLEPLLELRV